MTDRNRWLKDLLWFLVLGGVLAIAFRLWYGLGATTNLSDSVPWGLWKILNMVAGVALSTGGFTVGFLVYVLRLEEFRPLVKPAILIAFLGYGSSVFALVLDIGLPHRIWHPIVMWNEHSFLFEVAWCVMLYFTVTVLELSPTFLERLHLDWIAGLLHKIGAGVVIVGISLSCLHHSSLGALFLVTPQRLHPLWYSPRLALHFIVSAIGAGMMVVVLANLLYARWYDRESVFGPPSTAEGPSVPAVLEVMKEGTEGPATGPHFSMVVRLASIGAWVLGAYLALKIADLAATGAIGSLVSGTWESWFYGFELLLVAVIPVVIMLVPRARRSPAAVTLAAGSAALGLCWNRLNVGIFGYLRDSGTHYLPSATEWALSLGVLAAAALVFLIVVEAFPIFDEKWKERRIAKARFVADFDRNSGVWRTALSSPLNRVSLVAVFALPIAWASLYPPFVSGGTPADDVVRPPSAANADRSVLKIDGNHQGLAVVFPHKDHQERLGRDASCGRCHHVSWPSDHSTPCSRCHRRMEGSTKIFAHASHFASVAEREKLAGWIPENRSCAVCHARGTPKSAASAKPCLECHKKDMAATREPDGPLAFSQARGYRTAMHDTCISCHKQERERVRRPGLAECANCHQTLRSRSRVRVAGLRPTIDAWPVEVIP